MKKIILLFNLLIFCSSLFSGEMKSDLLAISDEIILGDIIKIKFPESIDLKIANSGIRLVEDIPRVLLYYLICTYENGNQFYFGIHLNIASEIKNKEEFIQNTGIKLVKKIPSYSSDYLNFGSEIESMIKSPSEYQTLLRNGTIVYRMIQEEWASGSSEDLSAYYIPKTGDQNIPEINIDFINTIKLGENFVPIMDDIVNNIEFVYPPNLFVNNK